jgi:hypothetical protein
LQITLAVDACLLFEKSERVTITGSRWRKHIGIVSLLGASALIGFFKKQRVQWVGDFMPVGVGQTKDTKESFGLLGQESPWRLPRAFFLASSSAEFQSSSELVVPYRNPAGYDGFFQSCQPRPPWRKAVKPLATIPAGITINHKVRRTAMMAIMISIRFVIGNLLPRTLYVTT